MSESQLSSTTGIAEPDTNNATFIGWRKKTDTYDPNRNWQDNRYPRRYEDWYKHLDFTNNGYKNGPKWWNTPFYRWLENIRLIETVADQLNLTEREAGRAKGLFLGFPGEKMGTYKETYALAACLCAVELDRRDQRRAHPNVPEEKRPSEFQRLTERFGVPGKEIRTAYGRIENRHRVGKLESPEEFDRFDLQEVSVDYEHALLADWPEETVNSGCV